MSHKQDYWEVIRRKIVPRLGSIAQFLEDITGKRLYAESETHNKEFVGRVDMPEEAFEKVLHELDFERNPLAAWKRLESNPKEFEEASFRKTGLVNYPDKQLHVILYDGSVINDADTPYTYIYAHLEYRWDEYPIKHYQTKEYDAHEGVRLMKKYLDERGIQYKAIRL